MNVLVVEDSDVDFEILINSIPNRFSRIAINRVRSGELAIAELYGRIQKADQWPIFIFLDLNLVGISGFETIKSLKGHRELRRIPVIVFSTSASRKDIQLSYDLGANAYFVKPMAFDDNCRLMEIIFDYWSSVRQCERLMNGDSTSHISEKISNS